MPFSNYLLIISNGSCIISDNLEFLPSLKNRNELVQTKRSKMFTAEGIKMLLYKYVYHMGIPYTYIYLLYIYIFIIYILYIYIFIIYIYIYIYITRISIMEIFGMQIDDVA